MCRDGNDGALKRRIRRDELRVARPASKWRRGWHCRRDNDVARTDVIPEFPRTLRQEAAGVPVIVRRRRDPTFDRLNQDIVDHPLLFIEKPALAKSEFEFADRPVGRHKVGKPDR